MFKMIGGDGQEYGPVTAEQLREWIAEHRADARTMVQPEGANHWTPLGKLPEFANDLAAAGVQGIGSPPPALPPAPGAPSADQDTLPRDYHLDIGACLNRAWTLLGAHFLLAVSASSIVWVLLVLGAYTCPGVLAGLIVAGALYGGLTVLYLRLIRGQPAGVGDVFGCFGAGFLQLLLVWIATQFLSRFAMIFLVLPGLYLKVIWVFSLALVADRGFQFWHAMEHSRKTVSRHLFQVAGLMLVAYLPFIVVSMFSALQLSEFMVLRFGDVFAHGTNLMTVLQEVGRRSSRLHSYEQLVWLFNLPFAQAVVLYAYEDIFGSSGRGRD